MQGTNQNERLIGMSTKPVHPSEYYKANDGMYYSIDNQWYWDIGSAYSAGEWKPTTKITNAERTVDSMNPWTVLVTETPAPLDVQQKAASTKVVAGPELVLAKDQNIAILLFGIRNAVKFDKANPDQLVIHVRAGA